MKIEPFALSLSKGFDKLSLNGFKTSQSRINRFKSKC